MTATAVFLISCGVFTWSSQTIRHEPAWRTFEFCQYAEIGANLARGKGYVTGLAEPMALAFIDRHQRSERSERWPVINRFPLPCFVTAGLMVIAGISDEAAAWSNGLALALLAAATSSAAYRWYGRWWGVTAALLWLANPSFYGYFPLLGTPDGLRIEFEHRLSPHHGRYFWFAAPALLLGVATLQSLVTRHRGFRWLAAAVVAGQLAFYADTWRGWIVQNRAPIYLGRDPIRAMLAQTIPQHAVVASNQPQLLVWYCGLKAISLPANLAELHEINRSSPTPVEYIFADLNFSAIEMDGRWGMLVQPDRTAGSPWEAWLLRDYEYVRHPRETRPFLFVLLRRRPPG